jgi:hypothetical protein
VRIARFIMFAVAAVMLFYIVAANIALKSGLVERLANDDPDVKMTWESAWTILPGLVHVRNFKLHHEDNNVQQYITIERVTVQIKLLSLLEKRFHASSVEAIGTRYRLRHKVMLASVSSLRSRLAAYPHIEGYPDPAIKQAPLPPSDPDRLWKIELDNVEASVDELWCLEYRYVGSAHASGGFRLLPAQRIMLFPSELTLEPGPLTVGETWPVMHRFRGRIHAQVDDFDVDLFAGLDVFRHISTSGWVRGDIPGLAFTEVYLGPHALLTDGDGPFEAVWGMDHGRFLLGTRIAYQTERARLDTTPFEFRTGLRAEVTVEPGQNGPVGMVRLDSPRLEIDGIGKRAEIRAAVVTRTHLALAASSVDVTSPWNLTLTHFAMDSIAVPDLRLMNVVTAPEDIVAKKGSMTGKANGDVDGEGHLKGRIEAELKDAAFVVNERLIAVGGTMKGRIFQPRADRAKGRIEDIELVLSLLSISTKSASTGLGWLRLDEGSLVYDGTSPTGIRGKVRVFMPKANPFLAALGADISSMPGIAKALVSTDNLRATLKLSHEPAATDVEVLEAKTDGAAVQGRLRRHGKDTFGAFLVRTKLLNAGVKIEKGETSVKMFAGRGWLTEQLRALGFGNGS